MIELQHIIPEVGKKYKTDANIILTVIKINYNDERKTVYYSFGECINFPDDCCSMHTFVRWIVEEIL